MSGTIEHFAVRHFFSEQQLLDVIPLSGLGATFPGPAASEGPANPLLLEKDGVPAKPGGGVLIAAA